MKKTYREVIRDIKKGEIWENERIKIYIENNSLITLFFKKSEYNCAGIMIELNDMFTLQRKEYDFNEAYKACKEGKEIESLKSRIEYKIIENKICHFSTGLERWFPTNTFSINEINNKWYIND